MKYTVWQCDKCATQKIGVALPQGWKFAFLTELEQMIGGYASSNGTTLLWCEGCVTAIKEAIPKEAKAKA